jgi:hypothetical protein
VEIIGPARLVRFVPNAAPRIQNCKCPGHRIAQIVSKLFEYDTIDPCVPFDTAKRRVKLDDFEAREELTDPGAE